MSEFWIYFEKGLRHILNLTAYDHILFLIALSIPYTFKDWSKLVVLVSIFAVSHTLATFLAIFEVVLIKNTLIELLIPLTILSVALLNLFTVGKSVKNGSSSLILFVTLFFGILHGLGFAGYYKTVVAESSQIKFIPISEFALGIEVGQIIVVFVVLILSYIVQNLFRFSKRDWTLVMSAFVIGVVLPLIINNSIWNR